MDDTRLKTGKSTASLAKSRSETPMIAGGGSESSVVKRATERPALIERVMEEVCQQDNLKAALKRVRANKGSPGVDGMTVDDLPGYLKDHWPAHRDQLLQGNYQPAPVKRVDIPKPGGGSRKLGIPTVLDRFIQQAVMQVLQGYWDRTFSAWSFGFRPGRSAHQAVARAQALIVQGFRWVADIDLEKFFDRVCHDILMSRIARRVGDKRLLTLIRAFLRAGMMENGLVGPTEEGTPQGGPLSPLLSNLLLDDLDQELERRGLQFVRYADDCNIYVRSERAGQRVMASVTRFLTNRLRLTVNQAKSAVAQPWQRKFLGFSFTSYKETRRRVAPQALDRFKERIRVLTRRTRGASLQQMTDQLGRYLTGWRGYFSFAATPSVFRNLDSWIRRRLRSVVWQQWKRGKVRFAELVKRGVSRDLAAKTAGSAHGPWRISLRPALHVAIPGRYLASLGLPSLGPPPTLVRTRA
jgi:RNA-directed DNA polymerase